MTSRKEVAHKVEWRNKRTADWQPCPWQMTHTDIRTTNISVGWTKYRKAAPNGKV